MVRLCSRYLHTNLDLDNCRDILSLADTFSLPQLRHNVLRYCTVLYYPALYCTVLYYPALYCTVHHVLRFMSENLKQFSGTQEFTGMEAGQLASLLSSNFPVTCQHYEAT